jgi:hypothetical protein
MSVSKVGWLRAIRGFRRNAYLLFITAGILGFTYWGITYLLTNLFIVRLGYGTEVVGNLNAQRPVGHHGGIGLRHRRLRDQAV